MDRRTRRARLALRLTVLTAIVLTPLVFVLKAYEVFYTPKRAVIVTLGGLAFPLLILVRARLPARAWLPATLVLVAAALALPGSVAPRAVIERLTLLAACAVLAAAVAAGLVGTRRLLAAACAVHGLVVLYGALQFIGATWLVAWLGLDIGWTSFGPGIHYSTLGNPTMLGWSCAFMLPSLAAIGLSGRKRAGRVATWTTAGLSALALFYARSMSSLGGTAVAVLVALHGWTSIGRRPRVGTVVGVGAGVLAGIVLIGWLSLRGSAVWGAVSGGQPVLGRAFCAHAAMVASRDAPILGTGAGTMIYVGGAAQGRVWPVWHDRRPEWAERVLPHLELFIRNDPLQVLVEHGVVGLGLLVWVVAAALRLGRIAARRALRRRDPDCARLAVALRGSVVGLAAIAWIEYPFETPAAMLLFIVAGVGGLAALAPDRIRPRSERPVRGPSGVPVAAAAAVALWCGVQTGQWIQASRLLHLAHHLETTGSRDAGLQFERTLMLRSEVLDRVAAYFYHARWLERQAPGEATPARLEYARALELFPDFPEALGARMDAAVREANRFRRTEPEFAADLRAGARADFERLRRLRPDDGTLEGRIRRLQ